MGFGFKASGQQILSPVQELTQLAQVAGDNFDQALDYLQGSSDGPTLGYVGDEPTYITDARPNRLVTYNNLFVVSELEVGATTTLSAINVASPYSITLDLSATSTSPSAAGSVLMTQDSVCHFATLIVTKNSTAIGGRQGTGSPFAISVATSTSASIGNGASIIATTTIPTTTGKLLDTLVNGGSAISVAGQSFQVKNGEVVVVGFNGITGDPATSTDALAGMRGKLTLNCVSQS